MEKENIVKPMLFKDLGPGDLFVPYSKDKPDNVDFGNIFVRMMDVVKSVNSVSLIDGYVAYFRLEDTVYKVEAKIVAK